VLNPDVLNNTKIAQSDRCLYSTPQYSAMNLFFMVHARLIADCFAAFPPRILHIAGFITIGVCRVMIEEGFPPNPDGRAPDGTDTPWRTFVSMHMNTMVACDFFCKSVFRGWTPMGKRLAHCLMFIHLGTRKITVSPATYEPNES
jgi:hypothetical protein